MRYEADMGPSLCAFLFEGFGLHCVEEEFSAGYGIADFVGVRYNEAGVRVRHGRGPATVVPNLGALFMLNNIPRGKPILPHTLARRVGRSISHVKSLVRSELCETGLVEQVEGGFVRGRELLSPIEEVVSVEAKLHRWRDALAQAKRYQHFSTRVFVALPMSTVANADRGLFRRHNIGLLGVGEDGVTLIMKPQHIRPRSPYMFQYCVEHFLGKRCPPFSGTAPLPRQTRCDCIAQLV